MRTRQTCGISVVALVLTAIFVTSSNAAVVDAVSLAKDNVRITGAEGQKLAHARRDHHCHNLPRRTYCHKAQRLPQNWPPNADTPARNSEPCWGNRWSCLFG